MSNDDARRRQSLLEVVRLIQEKVSAEHQRGLHQGLLAYKSDPLFWDELLDRLGRGLGPIASRRAVEL